MLAAATGGGVAAQRSRLCRAEEPEWDRGGRRSGADGGRRSWAGPAEEAIRLGAEKTVAGGGACSPPTRQRRRESRAARNFACEAFFSRDCSLRWARVGS